MDSLTKSGSSNNGIFNSDRDETAPASPFENLLVWVVLGVAALALIFT